MGGQTTSKGLTAEGRQRGDKYEVNEEKEEEQNKARIEQRYGEGSGVGG